MRRVSFTPIVLGLLAVIAIALTYRAVAAQERIQTASSPTLIAITADMLVKNDKEVRKNLGEIVFIEGVIHYNARQKNPLPLLVVHDGTAYACPGAEKLADKKVVMAAVPKEVIIPARLPTDEPFGGDPRTDKEQRFIDFQNWRVLKASNRTKS